MRAPKTLSFSIYLATLATVLICGCATQKTSVKSNLSDDYNGGASRIFVVLNTRELDDETQDIRFKQLEFGLGDPDSVCFGTDFLKEVASRFDEMDVEFEYYRNTEVELDKEECALLAKQFRADEVVWVKEDFIGMHHNNGTWALVPYEEVAELTLEASIQSDTKEDALAWRASIKVKKGTGDWSDMAEASGSALVDMLLAEGIVASE